MEAAIQQFVAHLKQIPGIEIYAFIAVWLAAESCGLPLPNELVLLAAGSLAGQGIVSPVLLVLVATVCSVAGASAAYLIGRRGGRAAVLRFGRYIRLDAARLDAVERWFAQAGAVAIGISRITPFVRTVASFPAGMLELPFRTFLIASTLGSLVWCTIMVTLGDLLGANYVIALHLIERYTLPAVIVLLAVIGGYFWLHRRLERVEREIGSTGGGAAGTKRKRPDAGRG
jgi:membrane protein DedA with SNARE-associated domain